MRLRLAVLLCVFVSACQEAGLPPDGPCEPGCPLPPRGLGDTFDSGELLHQVVPREGYGGLKVRLAEDRIYVLETTRDGSSGSARRLSAYSSQARLLWTLAEAPGEHLSDFTVHPSGEVTLGLEDTGAERGGYVLIRLSAEGRTLARAPLPEATTLPAGDLGANLPPRPFRMKSQGWHALTDGWLRTEARGEDLAVAFLSLVDEPVTVPVRAPELVSGVMGLRWSQGGYAEQWTRVVDGRHTVEPVAWAYDELRWREAAQRPLLAVDEDGHVVVGRTWNTRRCLAASETFQELPRLDCFTREDVTSPMDTEYQPLAFTSFSPTGGREGTHSFVPRLVAEFVVFDLAARGGEVALAGTAVRGNGSGGVDYYPPEPGSDEKMTPYDGYVAVLGRSTGTLRFEQYVGGGRADHFSALRWTDAGLLLAGASGWDRWSGGMSISRGAGPLLALVSPDGERVRMRSLPLDGGSRHFYLLGVDARGAEVVAVGLAEAPMTHSGDGGQTANMTFGGLTVELR